MSLFDPPPYLSSPTGTQRGIRAHIRRTAEISWTQSRWGFSLTSPSDSSSPPDIAMCGPVLWTCRLRLLVFKVAFGSDTRNSLLVLAPSSGSSICFPSLCLFPANLFVASCLPRVTTFLALTCRIHYLHSERRTWRWSGARDQVVEICNSGYLPFGIRSTYPFSPLRMEYYCVSNSLFFW